MVDTLLYLVVSQVKVGSRTHFRVISMGLEQISSSAGNAHLVRLLAINLSRFYHEMAKIATHSRD